MEVFFKETLEKGDRFKVPPISINFKEGSLPSYQARAFDTPCHLRELYDREAGILEPMGMIE